MSILWAYAITVILVGSVFGIAWYTRRRATHIKPPQHTADKQHLEDEGRDR